MSPSKSMEIAVSDTSAASGRVFSTPAKAVASRAARNKAALLDRPRLIAESDTESQMPRVDDFAEPRDTAPKKPASGTAPTWYTAAEQEDEMDNQVELENFDPFGDMNLGEMEPAVGGYDPLTKPTTDSEAARLLFQEVEYVMYTNDGGVIRTSARPTVVRNNYEQLSSIQSASLSGELQEAVACLRANRDVAEILPANGLPESIMTRDRIERMASEHTVGSADWQPSLDTQNTISSELLQPIVPDAKARNSLFSLSRF